MKIKELIKELESLDGELHIFVDGYEGGCNEVIVNNNIKDIALNVNDEWWYGKHEEYKVRRHGDKCEIVKGIIISNKTK